MVENKKCNVFDALIERRMGTSINPPPTTEDGDPTVEDLTNQNNLDDEMDEPVESPDHEDILDSMGRILVLQQLRTETQQWKISQTKTTLTMKWMNW